MAKKTEFPGNETIESKSKSDKAIFIFVLLAPLPLFVLYLVMLFIGK